MQFYWGIAIVATILFAGQALLTFIGIDSMDGGDMDVDVADGDTMDAGGAMSLFSIRSLINFAVGFGWTGICLRQSIENDFLLALIAFCVGLAFGAMYPLMRRKLMRLESNGAYKVADTIGKEADVYLRIPANGKGRGKVQVSIGGAMHELDAMSADDAFPTGERVRIISQQGNVVIVTKA